MEANILSLEMLQNAIKVCRQPRDDFRIVLSSYDYDQAKEAGFDMANYVKSELIPVGETIAKNPELLEATDIESNSI